MISLTFGIDESEFGAQALLLARGVMAEWCMAKVTAHVLILWSCD